MTVSRQIFGLGIPLAVAYTAWRVNQLNNLYPLLPASSYHQTPSVLPTLPERFYETDHIYARIPYTPPSDKETTPLDDLLEAFYQTWTLRVEGLVAKLVNYQTPREMYHEGDQSFCSGIFRIWSRTPNSAFIRWQFARTNDKALKASNWMTMPRGGTQELTAVTTTESGRMELEIGYACAQYTDTKDGDVFGVGLALHRFYMRFLLDSARRRLERRVAERR